MKEEKIYLFHFNFVVFVLSFKKNIGKFCEEESHKKM